jgi:S23 ribosomal protein.
MGDFKKLLVWQEARKLTKGVFKAADKIEGSTGRILQSQICRAVLSIPANIAEGSAKKGDREFSRFLKIARGSIAELESHLIIAGDLGAISESDRALLLTKLREVARMLSGFLEQVLVGAELKERSTTSEPKSRRATFPKRDSG